jgi:hypothetical protein
LIPAASVAGRLTIEKSPSACDAKLKTSLEDTFVTALTDEKVAPNAPLTFRTLTRGDSPDEKGEFKINGLMPGHYRLNAGLRVETWFVKSISAASPNATAGKPAAARPGTSDLSRTGLMLKPSEKFSGVTVIATDGGTSLQGKIAAKEGTKLPSRLLVHLVPAEPAAADEVLRYAERRVGDSGDFSFINLAPGKYWLLTRALPDSDQPERPKPLTHWDATERARLRKDAEAAKHEIELKACQRVKDHVLVQ